MVKTTVKIEIEITYIKDDESGFELSLDEVVKKLKEGYHMGRDGNDEMEYSFAITSEING